MKNYKYIILKNKFKYFLYLVMTAVYTFLIMIKAVKTLECPHCGQKYYKFPKYCSECGKRLLGRK